MVVERAEGVGDVETVVHRVEVSVEEFVDVHGTVEEVLPCIHYKPDRPHSSMLEHASTLMEKKRYIRSKQELSDGN